MSIHHCSKSIFDVKVDAKINPVNCVGIMGNGLAFAYKERYPTHFKHYKSLCKRKMLTTGVLIWTPVVCDKTKYVVAFPTKSHWQENSNLWIIFEGMERLLEDIDRLSIKSVSIPMLGCGKGGLLWSDVYPIIAFYAAQRPLVDFVIHGPPKPGPYPDVGFPVLDKMPF